MLFVKKTLKHCTRTYTFIGVVSKFGGTFLVTGHAQAGSAGPDWDAIAALAATPALVNGRMLQMDGAFLLGFGPRTPAAILELARALYGDRVAAN